MPWSIPLFKTYSDDDDVDAVAEVIRRGTFWAVGDEIVQFEEAIAAFTGRRFALSFNSGTSALHVMLAAYGIEGKEVIVPSFTFIATANAVLLAGGKPVFAESESETFGLDASDVATRITADTRAIIAYHYGGFPARDSDELRALAREKNVLLVEDAAQSLGARTADTKVGAFGESAIFSLCQNKVLSTGEGGLLVTDSEDVYEKAKLLRSHGRLEAGEDYFSSIGDNDYTIVGYNFRLPTMLAALGLSQLGKIDKVISMRRKLAREITRRLGAIAGLRVPREIDGHFQAYQMYTILLDDPGIRDSLQAHLAELGVMTKVYFQPIHLKSLYRQHGWHEGLLPRTESLSGRVLTLPLFPTMTPDEVEHVCCSILSFFEKGCSR